MIDPTRDILQRMLNAWPRCAQPGCNQRATFFSSYGVANCAGCHRAAFSEDHGTHMVSTELLQEAEQALLFPDRSHSPKWLIDTALHVSEARVAMEPGKPPDLAKVDECLRAAMAAMGTPDSLHIVPVVRMTERLVTQITGAVMDDRAPGIRMTHDDEQWYRAVVENVLHHVRLDDLPSPEAVKVSLPAWITVERVNDFPGIVQKYTVYTDAGAARAHAKWDQILPAYLVGLACTLHEDCRTYPDLGLACEARRRRGETMVATEPDDG